MKNNLTHDQMTVNVSSGVPTESIDIICS